MDLGGNAARLQPLLQAAFWEIGPKDTGSEGARRLDRSDAEFGGHEIGEHRPLGPALKERNQPVYKDFFHRYDGASIRLLERFPPDPELLSSREGVD